MLSWLCIPRVKEIRSFCGLRETIWAQHFTDFWEASTMCGDAACQEMGKWHQKSISEPLLNHITFNASVTESTSNQKRLFLLIFTISAANLQHLPGKQNKLKSGDTKPCVWKSNTAIQWHWSKHEPCRCGTRWRATFFLQMECKTVAPTAVQKC